jgi:hypothetical protein
MMRGGMARTAAAAALVMVALGGGIGRADEISSAFSLFDTVRVGAYAHNPGMKESGDVDISGHLITSRLNVSATGNAFADFFLSPRLHVGAMVNTAGDTSYGYAGLTWRTGEWNRFFGELEFGGAVNNYDNAPGRINMGCHVTFRESAGIGYRFTPNFDVVANIEHISHASLCSDSNPGLTNLGVRVGYRF